MIEINKIYNEECLEGMKRIPDKFVDMIFQHYNNFFNGYF